MIDPKSFLSDPDLSGKYSNMPLNSSFYEDDDSDDDLSLYTTATNLRSRNPFKKIDRIAGYINLLLYCTLPVHCISIALGFIHKDQCPADVRVPRFLFFGGMAGLMAIILRFIILFKWRNIKRKYKIQDQEFNSDHHPGISLVRSVMYIFVVFAVIWNINATLYMFTVEVNLEDKDSQIYCHPTVYYLSFFLVIVFDLFAGLLATGWVVAIVMGLCDPDLLVQYGYFPRSKEIDSLKESTKTKKNSRVENTNTTKANTKSNGLSRAENGKSSRHSSPVSGDDGDDELGSRKSFSTADWDNSNNNTANNINQVVNAEDVMDKSNLSIVRFARNVAARRISANPDEIRGTAMKLDITNFPKGPLTQLERQNSQQAANNLRQ